MGWLLPSRPDNNNGDLLGLSSRYKMPANVSKARDEEIGKSIARTQVIKTDMAGLADAGYAYIFATESLTSATTAAIGRTPDAYDRLQAGIDTVANAMQAKLRELGGQA